MPANPIQIADAALYLSKTQPSLGISDPYELTEAQLNAAANLLKQQRPLIKKYWALASDEIELFKNGDAVIGAAWPYQYSHADGRQGAGQADHPQRGGDRAGPTRGCSRRTPKHPNCAYKWVNWVSSPKVQAEQAISYGETPVNTKACPYMEKIEKGSCALYHADAPAAYFDTIKFWKTPVAECGNGQSDCMDYTQVAAEVDRSNRVAPSGGEAGELDRLRRRRATPASACRRRCSAGRGCAAGLLLSGPLAWFVLIYLAALVLLFISALWSVDSFTGNLVHTLDAGQLQNARHGRHVPHDRAAHDRDRGGGDA